MIRHTETAHLARLRPAKQPVEPAKAAEDLPRICTSDGYPFELLWRDSE
ncbi:hypothetical protein [Poseidonocella sp. HB161398]|nr:hypothetical protein [Poseidonocella sp. HB161398]